MRIKSFIIGQGAPISTRCVILVSNGNLESMHHVIEAFSDVVVSLDRIMLDGAPLRLLHVMKNKFMNGFPATFLFTLEGGTFSYCSPLPPVASRRITTWTAIPDKDGRCSSGSGAIDDFFKVGLLLGSLNFFEVDLPAINHARFLLISPILNFLKQDRAVIISSLSGLKSNLIDKESLACCIDGSTINEYLRVLSMHGEPAVDGRPYLMTPPKKGVSSFEHLPVVYDEMCKKTNYRPILLVTEIDAWNLHDPAYRKTILQHINFVKNANVIELMIAPLLEERDVITIISQLADSHLRVYNIHGVPVMTGIHPPVPNVAFNFSMPPSYAITLRRFL